jgi:hypothetical protein
LTEKFGAAYPDYRAGRSATVSESSPRARDAQPRVSSDDRVAGCGRLLALKAAFNW